MDDNEENEGLTELATGDAIDTTARDADNGEVAEEEGDRQLRRAIMDPDTDTPADVAGAAGVLCGWVLCYEMSHRWSRISRRCSQGLSHPT